MPTSKVPQPHHSALHLPSTPASTGHGSHSCTQRTTNHACSFYFSHSALAWHFFHHWRKEHHQLPLCTAVRLNSLIITEILTSDSSSASLHVAISMTTQKPGQIPAGQGNLTQPGKWPGHCECPQLPGAGKRSPEHISCWLGVQAATGVGWHRSDSKLSQASSDANAVACSINTALQEFPISSYFECNTAEYRSLSSHFLHLYLQQVKPMMQEDDRIFSLQPLYLFYCLGATFPIFLVCCPQLQYTLIHFTCPLIHFLCGNTTTSLRKLNRRCYLLLRFQAWQAAELRKLPLVHLYTQHCGTPRKHTVVNKGSWHF